MNGTRARRLCELTVGCLLCCLICNTWLVEGLFVPMVIHSDSMMPALCGPRHQWHCAGCGETFFCSVEGLPGGGRGAVCPLCHAANDPDAAVARAGQRVLVDRLAASWGRLGRWQTAVFRSPDQPADLCIKRIVGLPGETLAIHAGDLWIDGQLARKDLRQARVMAIEVPSGVEAAYRWRPRWSAATWRANGQRWSYQPDGHRGDDFAWLGFERDAGSEASGCGDVVILDDNPLDQNESRQLRPVRDVVVTATVRADRSSEIAVELGDASERVQIQWNLGTQRGTICVNGQVCQQFVCGSISPGSAARIEAMLVDRRCELAIEGQTVARHDLAPKGPATEGSAIRIAIGARGGNAEVLDPRVFRDIYYLPGRDGESREYPLSESEYFVLGDNSPHAVDSRQWPAGSVPCAAIVGRALAW